MTGLTLVEVRDQLRAAHPTARFNPPTLDGIPWLAFCDIPMCPCFIPCVEPCDDWCDPEDATLGLRCGCCGWPRHRHETEDPS